MMLTYLFEKQDYKAMYADIHPDNIMKVAVAAGIITNDVHEDDLEFIRNEISSRYKVLDDSINSFRIKYRKNDRIVWFIRFYKMVYLMTVYTTFSIKIPMMELDDFYSLFKFTTKMRQNMGGLFDVVFKDGHYSFTSSVRNTITLLDHYYSLGIAAIDEYVFGYQTKEQIISNFRNIEKEYMEKQKRYILFQQQAFEDVEILIDFKDGFYWVDLQKSSCDLEGRAAGHCGNAAANRHNETVLSLREVDMKAMKWKPWATFILNTETGKLGEMKGPFNEKPDRKHHKYIVELLKLPIIEGIVGGGHAPEHNFSIMDLDERVRDELIELKPDLLSLTEAWLHQNLNEKQLKEVSATMESDLTGMEVVSLDNDNVVLEFLYYDITNDFVDIYKELIELYPDHKDSAFILKCTDTDGEVDLNEYFENGPYVKEETLINNFLIYLVKSYKPLKRIIFAKFKNVFSQKSFDFIKDKEFLVSDMQEIVLYLKRYYPDSYQEIKKTYSKFLEMFIFESLKNYISYVSYGYGGVFITLDENGHIKTRLEVGVYEISEYYSDGADGAYDNFIYSMNYGDFDMSENVKDLLINREGYHHYETQPFKELLNVLSGAKITSNLITGAELKEKDTVNLCGKLIYKAFK